MLKNIMYAVVILAALAFGYRQLWPSTAEIPPQDVPVKSALNAEAEIAKVEQMAVDAKKVRDNQIEGLLNRQDGIEKKINGLTAYLERDKKRIFRKIPHDSLPVYGAMMEGYLAEMHQIDLKLDELGYKFGTGDRGGKTPAVKF